jgi:hypothetical protein
MQARLTTLSEAPMLHNICLAWIGSFLVIVGYEYLHFRYVSGKSVPQALMAAREIVLILASIFYYTSSAFLGAFTALYFYDPRTMTQGRIGAAIGMLLGMWVLALLLQAALNLVRKMQGAPTQPIIYFNHNAFAFFRRKKADGKSDEDEKT